MLNLNPPLSLFDRVWARHVIVPNVANPGGEELLFVDRNLVHEGGTFLAFDQMRVEGRTVRKPKQTLAVTDHYLSSTQRATAPASIANPEIRRVVDLLDSNAREFGIEHSACITRGRASSTWSARSLAGRSRAC